MAGLLTDSSVPMPSRRRLSAEEQAAAAGSGLCSSCIGTSDGVSQQRDCSGLPPDSLFIRTAGSAVRNQFKCKSSEKL